MDATKLTKEQCVTILNALHNRNQMLHDLMVIYAKEDNIREVEYCIKERASIKNLIKIFKAL